MDEAGIYLSKLLLGTNITPNQLTVMGLLLGISGILLITFPHFILSFIGFLLVLFFWVVDYTDGVIARYKKITSKRGEYYDNLGHFITPLLFFAMGMQLFNRTGDVIPLLLGAVSSWIYLGIDFNAKLMVLTTGEKKAQFYLNSSETKKGKSLLFKTHKNITFSVHIVLFFLAAQVAEQVVPELVSGISFYLLLCFTPVIISTFFIQIYLYSQKL